MKPNNALLWLFLLPLLVPLLTWSIRRTQSAKLTYYNVGGFKGTSAGERAAMKKLAEAVRDEHGLGKLRAEWSVSALAPESKRGISLYSVEFEPEQKRLVRYASVPNPEKRWEVITTQYVGVEEGAIQQVSAAGGVAADLVQRGAVLKEHGLANLDAQGRPILEW